MIFYRAADQAKAATDTNDRSPGNRRAARLFQRIFRNSTEIVIEPSAPTPDQAMKTFFESWYVLRTKLLLFSKI